MPNTALISGEPQKPVTQVRLSLEEQQAFLNIQNSILQMVASNRPQEEIFSELCLMAEALVPDSIATVMLIQSHANMDVISAPSVAAEDQQLLNGLKPGPTAGTCGNAVYRNHAVYASNVHEDSRCLDICTVFDQFELNSCWSNPVRNADGESIGSFALSSFEKREPSSFHRELLAIGGYIIGIILERSMQQEKLERLAYQDSLTGLDNRSSFFIQLSDYIGKAEQEEGSFGLVYIDLDRFKNLNDNFGHSYGDEILKLIGSRLREHTSDARCLARVGGDEFVVLANSIEDAETLGRNVIEALSKPIQYQSYHFSLDCSIGIACYPQDGTDSETLLKNADTAMYRAKRQDIKMCYYKPEFTSKAKENFKIENELRSAIENDEFSLYLQPKIGAKAQRRTGYEALLRWKNSEGVFVPPSVFIPVAEKTGLITRIGDWVVRTALMQAEALAAHTDENFNLAINISGAQLSRAHIEGILAHIDQSSFPNSAIYFEITETVLVQEASYVSDLLELIRESGVRLSIDDFGIGYSSLAYLKRFKVSQLKMDKSLIDDLDESEDSLAIAKAVIALGRSLGLEVVAEGVETQAQVEILCALDCDTLQGFHYSKAVPFDTILKLL